GGKGLVQGVEFVKDRRTKERFPDAFGVRVGRRALANGLLCRFDPHWLAFGPPLVTTAEQLGEMLAGLGRSLGEARGGAEGERRRPAPRQPARRGGSWGAPASFSLPG